MKKEIEEIKTVKEKVRKIYCDRCGQEIISKYVYGVHLYYEGCRPPSLEYDQCRDEYDICGKCQDDFNNIFLKNKDKAKP